mmetsp:Transcript_58/g.85  ORF Transcript_58/g.85 Transcript_58/m.85 type:complete len:115 (-) Transcript_58:40-384(-)
MIPTAKAALAAASTAASAVTATTSTVTATTTTTRARALSLYRQLIRGAYRMPTPNRTNFILKKTRTEFRKYQQETDPEQIEFRLRLADTNLDTVLVQAEHLTRLIEDPKCQNDL